MASYARHPHRRTASGLASDGCARFTPVRRPRRLVALVALVAAAALGLAACTPGGVAGPAASAPAPTGSSSPVASSPDPSSDSSGTGSPSASTSEATTTASPDPSTSCASLVNRLSLVERVGQLLMVGVSSTQLSPDQAAVISRTHAGSVLLLGNSTGGSSVTKQVVADVRAAADRPNRVSVVLAADQEGGLVQRLSGPGYSDIPSAVLQSELSDAELTREAELWGNQLDKAGINLNLAPVADVVPRRLASVNEPIAKLRRGYGSSPDQVAEKVGAFTTGMDNAGLATAVKHFPGLGRVRGNTDNVRRVVDDTTTRRDDSLRGFEAARDAGVDMVMVSSAYYAKIDAKRQAVFSAEVIETMIRGDLGFGGVVISDDLAAAAVENISAEQRAVRFVEAGGDLLIVGDPELAATMAEALVKRAGTDDAFAARIDQSVARVLAVKERRGLANC